ncbi:PhzF family phenazine biosynthesis protein [Streptomyces sp. WAC07061]|uniref:PhzF family phenazine biosynthesis protein n=1 Tax=Streptomyces sp. WAC07061 TaxID=2487410 RepID=UPI00163BF048|nr:PhzF family phenazine biosynthesis isomerase [Streptomyces sp. WAC07061]
MTRTRGRADPQGPPVAIVRACLRDGGGGSPTAVVDEAGFAGGTAPGDDDRRRGVPALAGTSHAVFVSAHDDPEGGPAFSLRFFTAEGELPACGHGTVAALAHLAERAGRRHPYRVTLHAGGRVFTGWTARRQGRAYASFDPGPVELRTPGAAERDLVLPALGIPRDATAPGLRVASVGRPRLLVPVRTRSALRALSPDFAGLRAACDRLGLLGCYVYTVPTPEGRAAARMFAPSIGVDEDIANANSTACLAAHLAGPGSAELAVDMGDSLGSPATVTATVRPGPSGPLVRLGGSAELAGGIRLPAP